MKALLIKAGDTIVIIGAAMVSIPFAVLLFLILLTIPNTKEKT